MILGGMGAQWNGVQRNQFESFLQRALLCRLMMPSEKLVNYAPVGWNNDPDASQRTSRSLTFQIFFKWISDCLSYNWSLVKVISIWDDDCYLMNLYSVLIYWLTFHPWEKCCTCMMCFYSWCFILRAVKWYFESADMFSCIVGVFWRAGTRVVGGGKVGWHKHFGDLILCL